MKILIVDDTETNRLILRTMLRKDGHSTVEAANGQEAVDRFEREQPDLIIMDVMMPVMDGYEATSVIKERAGDRFVPVMFLTSVTDDEGLAKCVAYGGDDFFTKPYSRTLLRAKIRALNRIRELHAVVKQQHDELLMRRRQEEHQRDVALGIFGKILCNGYADHPNLDYRLFPAERLSGDLLLAAHAPHGPLHVMIGDFTGHGLAAAVGAVPVAEIFYSMTLGGFAIGRIAAEINRRLQSILPTDLFCSACLLEWHPVAGRISVWNGGMPDGLVMRPAHGLVHRFRSRHLPLSLLDPDHFDPATETIEVHPDDRVYVYSDGLIEATNASGEMFGTDRLESLVADPKQSADVCGNICQALSRFCQGWPPLDDIALARLICGPAFLPEHRSRPSKPPRGSRPSTWRFRLELEAGMLEHMDPLPAIMRALMDLEDLAEHRDSLFTILVELISNAIDHGLLGLHSSLKSTPEGFTEYYRRREQHLAKVHGGFLKIHIEHERQEASGTIVIRVEDSGAGFDFTHVVPTLADNASYSGRGIELVRRLCRELRYLGNGNTAEAVYAWSSCSTDGSAR